MVNISIELSDHELKDLQYACSLTSSTIQEFSHRRIIQSVHNIIKGEDNRLKYEKKKTGAKPACFRCSFHKENCLNTDRCIECRADCRDYGELTGYRARKVRTDLPPISKIKQVTPSVRKARS